MPSRSPRCTAVTDSSPRCFTSGSRMTAPATTISARRASKRLRRCAGDMSTRSSTAWEICRAVACAVPSEAAKPTTAPMVPELPSAARGAPAIRAGSPSVSASET